MVDKHSHDSLERNEAMRLEHGKFAMSLLVVL